MAAVLNIWLQGVTAHSEETTTGVIVMEQSSLAATAAVRSTLTVSRLRGGTGTVVGLCDCCDRSDCCDCCDRACVRFKYFYFQPSWRKGLRRRAVTFLHQKHSTLHTPHSTPTLAHSPTPHSTLHTPHSTLHTPHSTLHTPHTPSIQ